MRATIKKSKQAIAILILAVTTSCTSQGNLSTPPPLTAEVLWVHSTTDASHLTTIITENYEDDIVLDHSNGNDISLLNQVTTGEIDYFFTHHLPTNAQNYWSAPLAQDGIAILRHQDNTITELSIEQLRRIYRGFITNWSELGGDDAEIVLYSRQETASIRLEFEQIVMGQQQTSPNARVLTSSNAILEQINQDRHSIAYIPISLLEINTQTIAINSVSPSATTLSDDTYPLRLNIYVIGLQAPESSYARLFAWIQNLDRTILDNHYAPLPR